MTFFDFLRINFSILGIVSICFIFPILCAASYGEWFMIPFFFVPMVIFIFLALVIIYAGRKRKITMSTRGAFIIVASAWIFSSLLGALPFYFSGMIPDFCDAFFESVSGFTTTGATILSEIESLPMSVNLWRCETHWLGGMGIVALTVALFPLLGVGGFQLIKAETTGPEKGKVTPKITNTAKALWLIYFGFTVIQAVLLMFAGMDFWDAVAHAFSTLGTGGFSTRNSSIGAYDSVAIDVICTVFMLLAGINFSLYFYLLAGKFDDIRNNSELKAYVGIVLVAILSITIVLKPSYGSFFTSLRYSAFQVATIISTTGFATTDFTFWPQAAQLLIFSLFFIGGSSGSTSGGVKVVRWVILQKQAKNEILRMLHPHGVFSIRLNARPGRKDIVFTVTSFMMVYSMLIFLTSVFGAFAGLEVIEAFTGALSMVGNIGPGFGALGPSCNYGFLPSALKYWYMFAMLAGRLELYTLIIFFIPDFWKK